MTRKGRGPLEDEDDDHSTRATSLELKPLPVPAPHSAPKKPDDKTLQVGSGYRLAPSVLGFALTWRDDRVLVTDGRAQLGSGEGNTLVIGDATASRFHCELRIEDNRVLVRDLGSTNGTFVDGVRIREAYLKDGSRLKLGTAEVSFELEGTRHFLPVSDASTFGELVGPSSVMRQLFSVLEKAARSDTTLILDGETGTGKTRAASAIHEKSARAHKPFLVVDCGALPPTLLEAELFGHEKGAFTGAVNRRVGVFEEAEGGTVLLDEIGEMPLELQPRLLRVLEEKQIKRLGQNKFTPIDVRILAATHRDLRAEVNAGKFRADLYFRLAVVRVTVPSLRDRLADLPAIARTVLAQLGATQRTHPRLFEETFLASLSRADWPGNVRELRNHLERCMLFDEEMPLGERAASGAASTPESWSGLSLTSARQRMIEQFERAYLAQLLERHEGKVSLAAKEAEVDRVYLYRLLRKYGLKAK
ncbi:MAG: sigma 54-interacting transcriptional regulator [Archangium sp.]|nr:sigma 54-interacting transcriptional regulator [Archangium sp.]MDP3154183.1 sigma 54-interacting transcriptional regulator [Archangium sp.]MDP3569522.1 sigma 54-interacting transcriptional regulator [Archangium sp.]